jgi:hypothetical protein
MICPHCGYRKPLNEAPVVKEKPKKAKVAKIAKKAKTSKKA